MSTMMNTTSLFFEKRDTSFFMATMLVSISILLGGNSLHANGVGIVNGSVGSYLTILESDVVVEVDNQIAVITTTQVFKNNTGQAVQLKYGFPLNEQANPVGLRWYTGGIWREASVKPEEQDNTIPGGGSGGGSSPDPRLIEYLGNQPLFFSPLDSLGKDSLITFELRYVELLPYFLGKVSFFYKNNVEDLQEEILNRQSFQFTLNSDREIIDIDLLNFVSEDALEQNSALISYEAFEQLADVDYHLEYELSSDGLGIFPLSTFVPDSLVNCDTMGNGFLSLIIEPESSVNTEVIEKNFTLIIDRSGSMSGNKIVQARDAASFIVNNLNFGDYFNIIDFSGNVSSFFDEHVLYSLENRDLALAYIDRISAGGSTNISEALITAINQFQVVDPNKANIIIFFTDGQATAGTTDTPGILSEVESRINSTETGIFLFTFGIGDNVDRRLLTLLASENNGLSQFVGGNDLEEEITRLFLSVNNPVLINTEISFEPDIIRDVHPISAANLYKGQQLIISGRYAEAQTVNMHLEGFAFNVPVSYDFQFELSDTNNLSKSILPKIWAKQKIDDLSVEYYQTTSPEDTARIRDEIDSISICYGVISVDFTSFEDDGNTVEIEESLEQSFTYKVNVLPIPFKDFLEIQISSHKSPNAEVDIQLIDIQGRVVSEATYSLSGSLSSFRLDNLAHLKPGIYFCKMMIGDEMQVIRVLKV